MKEPIYSRGAAVLVDTAPWVASREATHILIRCDVIGWNGLQYWLVPEPPREQLPLWVDEKWISGPADAITP